MTLESLMKLLSSNKDLDKTKILNINTRTIRVDIPEKNVELRNKITSIILNLLPNSTITKIRPNDVKFGIFTILVKPSKTAKKTPSSAFYGSLEELNISDFDTSNFRNISSEFANGNLVKNIKESSDVKCTSDLNMEIHKNMDKNYNGLTLKLDSYTFKNVLGCIPVTNGEPKADIVLVCRKGNILYPDGYISYKMGTNAKGFQNYSGLSENSSPYIFNHAETNRFYSMLHSLSNSNEKKDIYQKIEDNKIIGMSVWGSDFGKAFGINNCHVIAQGEVSISIYTIKYTHIQKNGDMKFDIQYQPVFGARYATGRNNRGPNGLNSKNFRIGIFPRAYRTAWLKDN